MAEKNPEKNRFHLSRKLIRAVTIFILAASGLVVLTNFSINMMAATGDYMHILTSWGQKHHQSLILLERYTNSGINADYEEYVRMQREVNEQAWVIDELFKTDPDTEMIFDALSSENVYPNEISSLLFAFQQFRHTGKMQNIFEKWSRLNLLKAKKQAITEEIYREFNSENADINLINQYKNEIHLLSEEWEELNLQLMGDVSRASVAIKRIGLWISVILGILLVLIGVVVTVRADKSLGKWEKILHEKEILLSEIHHRVKNNMALISALIDMESIQNRDSEQALENSRDRIQSIAMIHEILYQSESFSEINLNLYLHKLAEYIRNKYMNEEIQIVLQPQSDEVVLNINQALPVGLIVNEIIIHSLNKRVKKMDEEEIIISLSEIKNRLSLSIKDSSKSSMIPLMDESEESISLMIVNTLIQQLDAEVSLKPGNKQSFSMHFQKSDSSGSGNANL